VYVPIKLLKIKIITVPTLLPMPQKLKANNKN
jgi:hypothetical protein